LLLGVAVRSVRYLLRFPLWGDEASLGVSFLDRHSYMALIRPLDRCQVAPLLFLWTELTVIKLLGFSEYTLRLFPFVCGLASLALFRHLARLLFKGTAVVLAVAIFAVSYPCTRYGAEFKPYGTDLLVSLLLLTLAVRWWRRPAEVRWLWGLTALTPVALGFSFPAVFVAGGISLFAAAVLWSSDCRRGWWPWIVYNVVLIASFGGFFILSTKPQADQYLDVMAGEWSHAFPPWHSVAGLVAWLVKIHTGSLFAQPVGGDNFASTGTFLVCLVAAAVLWWRRRYATLLLGAAPFALNFVAAAMRRYPYGGHTRMAMHLTPLICLLAGYGAAVLLRRRRAAGPGDRTAARPMLAVLAVLALIGAGSIVRDLHLPAKDVDDLRGRDFASWFWGTMARDRELVCVKTDFGKAFPPAGIPWQCCISSSYLCNQRIYSPRHARGEPPRLELVSRSRPLACVQFWEHYIPYDQAAFDAWLESLKARYGLELVSSQRYPLSCDNRVERWTDRVEVYELAPVTPQRKTVATSRPSAR
jgi:hypothetical protein